MRKKTKKLLSIALACSLGMTSLLAACGGQSEFDDAHTLKIRYYVGGFGPDWIEAAADKFEAYKKAAGDPVYVDLTQDNNLQTSITTYLSSGRQLSDIYFNQDCDWQYFVSQGWVEPLDDLYETEVEKLDGTKIKIKDYIVDERQDVPYMTIRPGVGTSRPWILPWSQLSCGMVYNEQILLKTPRRSTGGNWTAPPTTMTELYEYVDDLNAAQLKSSDGTTVKPFAFGINKGQWWLTFPIKVWWAQYQGVLEASEQAKAKGQGSYYDFWDFGAPTYEFNESNPNVWEQEGLQVALDTLSSLIADQSKQTYKNALKDCDQLDGVSAEMAFVNGKAAFIFVGNWIENEMRDFIGDECTMKAMFVPTLDESVISLETGEPYLTGKATEDKINNNAEMDVCLIPSGASNKALAKEFLAFINSEEMLLEFTKQTGVARPFKYDPLKAEEGGDYTFSSYVKSALTMSKTADHNLIEYPRNKGGLTDETARKEFTSYIFTYKRPEIFQSIGSGPSLNGILSMSGKEIMQKIVNKTNKDYPTWVSELGIKDLLN